MAKARPVAAAREEVRAVRTVDRTKVAVATPAMELAPAAAVIPVVVAATLAAVVDRATRRVRCLVVSPASRLPVRGRC